MLIRLAVVFLSFFLVQIIAETKKKKHSNFKLRPAWGGEQTGWFDAEGLPTSIKINDEWVLPRGGTMEWLMTKGYVPDAENKNIMKPNPFDKRYKKPGPKYLPSLATSPLEYIYTPRAKKSIDPFAGLAEPMKKKYTPIPGIGNKLNQNGDKLDPGPVLDPDLPNLKDSPFDEPGVPALENREKLPPNDPFADELNNPVKPLPADLNKLPGKKVIIPTVTK